MVVNDLMLPPIPSLPLKLLQLTPPCLSLLTKDLFYYCATGVDP
jgi:hypothetical protein